MQLVDAACLSENDTAKLVIKDPNDPCAFGTIEPDGFGVLYMWTRGHTVPRMISAMTSELPAEEGQRRCICGEFHDFPDDGELLYNLHYHDGWEPIFFPSSPLKGLARAGL